MNNKADNNDYEFLESFRGANITHESCLGYVTRALEISGYDAIQTEFIIYAMRQAIDEMTPKAAATYYRKTRR